MGVPDECVPAMCGLVGFEHADARIFKWLSGMVRRQIEDPACCGGGEESEMADMAKMAANAALVAAPRPRRVSYK